MTKLTGRLCLLLILSATGCEYTKQEPEIPPIVVIDRCQYLACQTHCGYTVYTHKGNCTNHVVLLNKIAEDPNAFLLR